MLRMSLIYFAHLIDSNSDTVKFTDTDYDVFSDAACHVAGGGSPYARKTYRYTPLAAYICLVNPLVHPLACKVVFCLVDIFLAYLLWEIVELQLKRSERKDHSSGKIALFVSSLILNPMFFIMSARGSND
jgi:phosphatidylinositol glycan class M